MSRSHKATLAEGPIAAQLTRLTIPMIFGVVSIVAFNLVDAYFVGQMGAQELAALGFTIPVVLILGSIGMGLSMGASAVVSHAIGEGDPEKIRRLTTDSLFLALVFAAAFVIIGLLTVDPVFRALGASEEVMPLIKEYMYIWYAGVIFVIVPFVGNSAIRANGDTRTPAIIMTAMVGVNIVLDPILIFGWGPIPAMGMAGAAIATVIARALSLVLSFYVLHFRDRLITSRIPSLSELISSWKSLLHIGLPATATNLVVPLNTALITNLVAGFGEPAVAALGVVSRIDLVAITVVVALSSVIGPFVGQNMGAGKLERVRSGIRMSFTFALIWGMAMLFVIGLARNWVAPLFNDDAAVIEAMVLYLSIAPFGYAPRCIYALGNTVLNVMKRPLHASAITLLMMFGIYLPAAYLGAELFGLAGVFAAVAIAYIAGGSASYFMVSRALKKEEADLELSLAQVQ